MDAFSKDWDSDADSVYDEVEVVVGESVGAVLAVKFTREELEAIDHAAQFDGVLITEYVRRLALAAAAQPRFRITSLTA